MKNMLETTYSEEVIAKAEKLSRLVRQEKIGNWFLVPNSSRTGYYHVNLRKGEPIDKAFDCDCRWGSLRTQDVACSKKPRNYCSHVLAVIFYLVKHKILNNSWVKAIRGEG